MITIKEPIWSVGSFCKGYTGRGIGIKKSLLTDEDKVIVKIAYKDGFGRELFPNLLEIQSSIALKFPTRNIKGTDVVIVPLSEMKIVD